MAARTRTIGKSGVRGPTGPAGRTGTRGARGLTGPAGVDHRVAIETLDRELHGIYRTLSDHMAQLTQVQRQLDEMRKAIRKLGSSIKD